MADSGFDQIFPLGERNDAYAQYFMRPELPGSAHLGQRPGQQRVL